MQRGEMSVCGPATQGKSSVIEIRPNKYTQRDAVEMHLLENEVTKCRRHLKQAVLARDVKRKELIAAIRSGATIEDGPHEAWIETTHKLIVS